MPARDPSFAPATKWGRADAAAAAISRAIRRGAAAADQDQERGQKRDRVAHCGHRAQLTWFLRRNGLPPACGNSAARGGTGARPNSTAGRGQPVRRRACEGSTTAIPGKRAAGALVPCLPVQAAPFAQPAIEQCCGTRYRRRMGRPGSPRRRSLAERKSTAPGRLSDTIGARPRAALGARPGVRR